MFAILEILPKDNSRFSCLSERFSPPKIFLQEIKSEHHLPYYIIRCQERNKGIPWREIEDMAGRCKSRMLIQSNIALPEDVRLSSFVPSILPFKIIFNTAEKIIKALNIKVPKIHIGIVDKEAKGSLLIENLVFLCQILSVYTLNSEKYLKISSDLYERYGISIVISDSKDSLKDCILNLSLDKESDLKNSKGYHLGLYKSINKNNLSLGKILIPEEFYLPPIENISRFDYLCALYELCEAKALENIYCETVFYNNLELSLDSAAELIKESLHLNS